MSETRFRSGKLVFPDLTQLHLTGPYQVLARLPGAETLLLWKTLDPVRSEHGLTILPTATLSSCPPLDLVFVTGAEPVAERAVVDGNICTGGGVTAGIDVALAVAAEIAGRSTAEAIQLSIDYAPSPPFTAGSPETADAAVLGGVLAHSEPRQRDRAERVARSAAAL
jgi:cyclohexyl-isocyanide hydratase